MTSAVTDFSQFQRMRQGADAQDPAVLREVAGQFESLFLEILLKDMRSASLGDPIFGDSGQHDMYRDMLDRQLAVEMSRDRGIGLADLLVAQLGGEAAARPTPVASRDAVAYVSPYPAAAPAGLPWPPSPVAPTGSTRPASAAADWDSPGDFARAVWPHAVRAGERLGVAPESLLAQAALESGWGGRVAPGPDGGSSLNLFGIKAGQTWNGASVGKATLEYRDGIPRREVARFRAYPDLAAVFDDYADFIGTRPRYAAVVGSGADTARFAAALQNAGYATDPDYANKIERVADGATLRGIVAELKNGGGPPIRNRAAPGNAL